MTDARGPDADERLDARLRGLPRTIAPERDLWPTISARLEPRAATGRRRPAWLLQAAAAVLLVAGSSLLTARLLDRAPTAGKTARAAGPTVTAPANLGVVRAVPAAFGNNVRLDPGYVAARHQLTAMLQARLARMPPSTRAKLEVNLAEMRRAADEINAALAQQPGDPLLEELLLATYQDELAVLANVSQLTTDMTSDAAPPAAAKGMKL